MLHQQPHLRHGAAVATWQGWVMSSSNPPDGAYVPIEDGIQLVELLRQSGPPKYLRLSDHSVFRIPQEGLNPAGYTAAVIDCQGQWMDMLGMDSYAVQPLSKLSFYSCTIFSPDSDVAWAAETSFHGCNIVHPCEVWAAFTGVVPSRGNMSRICNGVPPGPCSLGLGVLRCCKTYSSNLTYPEVLINASIVHCRPPFPILLAMQAPRTTRRSGFN